MFENIIFRKAFFYDKLIELRRNKYLLNNDENRRKFIDDSKNFKEEQQVLNLYGDCLKKEEITELINCLNEIQLKDVIDRINKNSIDPNLLIDKACEFNLDKELVDSLENYNNNFLENIIVKTNDSITLNSLLKKEIRKDLLQKIIDKFYILELTEDSTNNFVDFIKDNTLSLEEEKLIINFLIDKKRYNELIRIINNNLVNDYNAIINCLLETNNKEIISQIKITILPVYLHSKIIEKICEIMNIDEIVSYKDLNNKNINSLFIEKLYNFNKYDEVLIYSEKLNLDEEDTEYVTKSIEKCSSAKVLCEAAINSTSIEIIDKIGYRLSKFNETKYIYDYLLNAKGYSKEVKELLINKIIKSKDIILICLLIIYIDIKILEKVSTIFKDKIELHNFIVNSGLFNDEIILDSTKKIFVNEESIIASKEKVKILKNNKKNVKNV